MGKTSFILFNELAAPVNSLSDEDAGKLFKAILEYQNGNQIQELSSTVSMAFLFIKQSLDRNAEQYEMICERNQINGKKGGRPTKPRKPTGLSGNPKNPEEPRGTQITQVNPPDPDPDPDPDNDNDKEEKKDAPPPKKKYQEYAYLAETEYEKLTTEYEEKIVQDFIGRLSDYIGQIGPRKAAKYKSHYHTIKNWMRLDGIEKRKKRVKDMTTKEKIEAGYLAPHEVAAIDAEKEKKNEL